MVPNIWCREDPISKLALHVPVWDLACYYEGSLMVLYYVVVRMNEQTVNMYRRSGGVGARKTVPYTRTTDRPTDFDSEGNNNNERVSRGWLRSCLALARKSQAQARKIQSSAQCKMQRRATSKEQQKYRKPQPATHCYFTTPANNSPTQHNTTQHNTPKSYPLISIKSHLTLASVPYT